MLSNQAKRQGSFYICAPCRRQYQQGLAQLRTRARIRSITLSSSLLYRSTASRLNPARSILPPTNRHIDHTRGYAAWGKFGSNTLPGQSNSAWGSALKGKQPETASGAPAASAWGGGLSTSKIPRSGDELRLSWEALNEPPKTQPEPAATKNPPESQQRERQQGDTKTASRPRTPTLDDLLGRPTSRPAPPGAEFPNLLRRESRTNTFRNTSPFNLPPDDQRSQDRYARERQDVDDFAGSRSWQRSSLPLGRDNGMSRSQPQPPRNDQFASGPRKQFGPRSSPRLDEGDQFADLAAAAQRQNEARPPAPSAGDDWGYPESRQPRYGRRQDNEWGPSSGSRQPRSEFRQEADLKPRRDDDWGYTESRQPRYDRRRQDNDWGSSSGSRQPRSQFRDEADFRPRRDDDWGYTESRQPRSEDEHDVNTWNRPHEDYKSSVAGGGAKTDRDLHDAEDRGSEGESTTQNIETQASDLEEEAVIIRTDRKGKGKPAKSKDKKKSSRRNYENETGGYEDFEDMRAIRYERQRRKEERKRAEEAVAPRTMVLPEYISVYDLAGALRIKPKQFLDNLEELGFENLLPDSLMTGETAALVAAEYGFEASVETGDGIDLKPRPPPEDPATLPSRPPVVTIMGHVDHGKTTLLDWMRKSSIAAGEHGGITQHIGAFSVKLRSGKVITFLDTPGHAAFLSMRQRGAYVTDIVVLVVAVDDSVMPQTIEALKHAQNAKVPIIVAVNKIDLDPNRMDHVKRDLADHGVEIEDVGGDVQVVGVSGVTGEGMDDLEETILTLSEILDLRAETDGMAEGWVLEASTKKEGKGATILVKRGTLRVGDLIVAGTTYTRIRIMRNEAGVDVEEAPPGTAVEIFGGWSEPPVAGDMVLQAPDENAAQVAVDYRLELAHRSAAASQKAEQEVFNREKAEKAALQKELDEAAAAAGESGDAEKAEEPVETGPKTINLIVRGDVMGSVEAVSDAIMEIGNNEVRPRVLRSLPGHINESDIDLLAAATGYIINFNIAIPGPIRRRAADAGVQILDHNIIYEVVTDVKRVLSQELAPITHQKVLAEAEVLQIFAINIKKRQYKNIAGVRVRTGIVTRGGLYRVMRDGEKIHDGKLDALKEGKKNANEIRKGAECGMSFDDFEDFQPGDIIQLYEEVVEKRYI